MTYATLKQEMGKQFVVIAELYIDSCQLTYGVSPCTASVPTTGTQKCFNTFQTCQDRANYDRGDGGTKIYRFSTTEVHEVQQAGDAPTFPSVTGANTAPTKLTPGKGFGIRSSVTIQLSDHPWTDVGVDPYVRTRTYVPDDQGSFWGKFLARNPNYEGRRIDILTGYLTADGAYAESNFRRRTYLITKISGPDTDGRVVVEAKDPLKKADIDKAQWPIASKASLTAAVEVGDTVFHVGDPDGQITAAFADGQEYLRVDDEIVRMQSIVDDTGGFYSLTVSRTDSPSVYDNSLNVQAEHDVGASVQPCWFFDAQRIDHVLEVLLADGAQIPTSYLPTTLWNDEVLDNGLDSYVLTALIVEPTGVQTLLDELSQHGIYIWWDERQQRVLIKAVIAQAFSSDPLTEDENIVAGSLAISRDVKNRISQSWIYYGLRFPTLDMTLLPSYSALQIKVDASAESPEEYDQSRAQRTFSRWLPISKSSTAGEIATRLLRSYRDSKIMATLTLDPKDDSAWTGDLVGVVTKLVQDESGAAVQKNYTVLEVDEIVADRGISYRYLLQSEPTLARAGVIAPDFVSDDVQHDGVDVVYDSDQVTFPAGAGPIQWDSSQDIVWSGDEVIFWTDLDPTPFPDYGDATDAQKNHYAFIAPDSGFFSDSTPAYQIR